MLVELGLGRFFGSIMTLTFNTLTVDHYEVLTSGELIGQLRRNGETWDFFTVRPIKLTIMNEVVAQINAFLVGK